jgi:hypothetical protein
MAKKTNLEFKKPDVVLLTYQNFINWVRNNKQASIAIGVIIVCVGLAIWGLSAFQASKNQRAQYALSQGMRSFEEYASTGKGDGLSKAEESFTHLSQTGPSPMRDVAKLYLARIALMKGKKDQALALYGEISKKPSTNVVKMLSDNALGSLQKK